MVNYQLSSNDPRLKQIRQQAEILKNMALQRQVQTKSGSFNVGRGVTIGNVQGFDLDAYRKAVESGASGTSLMRAATGNIYRVQPEVAKFIDDLSNKVDVSNNSLSNARSNTSSLKTAQDISNAVVDSSHDPASVLPDVNPISPEGIINMKTNNIAPVAHSLYENQAIDDMVSNSQSSTATPDEQVISFRKMAPQNYGIPPEQQVYDDMINANNQSEPDDSSGTNFVDYSQQGVDLGNPDELDTSQYE
jgi:hypothetical protein